MNELLLNQVAMAGSIAITGHTRPDGDCVGSNMALYHYLKDNYPDKLVDIYLEEIADSYRMISCTEDIKASWEETSVPAYDLFVVLDCSDKERITEGTSVLFENAKKTLNIDHHISNTKFADENYILPDASSACEVLYGLLDNSKIGKACAESVYMGIICDSGVFKYSQTSERTMCIAGTLLTKGVDSRKWIDGVFYEKTYRQNQLMGRALLESHVVLDGNCIYSCITRQIFDDYGADRNDLEGIVEQLRLTKGVEVAILISQAGEDIFKFSLRSKDKIDVNRIAGMFGGGGHILASGCTVRGDWKAAVQKMIEGVKEQLAAHV